jgi:hypothetical protein
MTRGQITAVGADLSNAVIALGHDGVSEDMLDSAFGTEGLQSQVLAQLVTRVITGVGSVGGENIHVPDIEVGDTIVSAVRSGVDTDNLLTLEDVLPWVSIADEEEIVFVEGEDFTADQALILTFIDANATDPYPA